LRPSIWSADIQKYFIDRSIPAWADDGGS
jgi:hypothetical protein